MICSCCCNETECAEAISCKGKDTLYICMPCKHTLFIRIIIEHGSGLVIKGKVRMLHG